MSREDEAPMALQPKILRDKEKKLWQEKRPRFQLLGFTSYVCSLAIESSSPTFYSARVPVSAGISKASCSLCEPETFEISDESFYVLVLKRRQFSGNPIFESMS